MTSDFRPYISVTRPLPKKKLLIVDGVSCKQTITKILVILQHICIMRIAINYIGIYQHLFIFLERNKVLILSLMFS